MDVWVMTGEVEFGDGGAARTFDGSDGVFSTADLGWAAMHRGYGPNGPDASRHERRDFEDTVYCRGCVGELRRVTVDAPLD